MKTIFRIVLFLVPVSAVAQTAIKLNTQFQYQSVESIWKYNTIGTVVSVEENELSVLPMPTISFFNSKGHFQELGLFQLGYNIDESQSILIDNSIRSREKISTFEIGFRYDYNFALSKNIKAIKPYLGVSTSLDYTNEINEPKVTSAFNSNGNKLISNLGIVPRLIWSLSPIIFLDLNIPINIFQVEYSQYIIHNPSLPLEQQKNRNTQTTFFPINYEVRLGIGVFLFKS